MRCLRVSDILCFIDGNGIRVVELWTGGFFLWMDEKFSCDGRVEVI